MYRRYKQTKRVKKGRNKMKKAKNIISRLWGILARPEMLVLPGQLAFFLLLAIVPMVTLIVYGVSLFNVSNH